MRLWAVHRPYCNPPLVYVIAESAKAAKSLADNHFGSASVDARKHVREIPLHIGGVLTVRGYDGIVYQGTITY